MCGRHIRTAAYVTYGKSKRVSGYSIGISFRLALFILTGWFINLRIPDTISETRCRTAPFAVHNFPEYPKTTPPPFCPARKYHNRYTYMLRGASQPLDSHVRRTDTINKTAVDAILSTNTHRQPKRRFSRRAPTLQADLQDNDTTCEGGGAIASTPITEWQPHTFSRKSYELFSGIFSLTSLSSFTKIPII